MSSSNENNSGQIKMRDLKILSDRISPGESNCITDISGVKVGQITLKRGEGKLCPGEGPVRTGVTAIIPGQNVYNNPRPAAVEIINGYGKAAGLAQVGEVRELSSPILLTNTLNVGSVSDALVDYIIEKHPDMGIKSTTFNPVVLECNDGYLNDLQGRHVKKEHVLRAIRKASSNAVCQGGRGAGTGMASFGFKGGIGTASCCFEHEDKQHQMGCLVLNNFGKPGQLRIEGISTARLQDLLDEVKERHENDGNNLGAEEKEGHSGKQACGSDGSIIIILAADAPLPPHQLERISRRATHGLGRTGSVSRHGSGDFVLAFSADCSNDSFNNIPAEILNKYFRAAVEITEEAVLNSLIAAGTMTGRDENRVPGLPKDRLEEIFRSGI